MKLRMYEEILLLALDDDKGIANLGGYHTNAMGGAAFAELVLTGRLEVADDKKKQVTLKDPSPTGDPILDECLAKVRDEKKKKSASHWASQFTGVKDLQKRSARQLVGKGILMEDQDKVLGLFKRTIFPERDGGPELELRDRLHEAVFTEKADITPETLVVLALTDAAHMLPKLFSKEEQKALKGRKERIKSLTSGDMAAEATREAVQAIQTAVMVSTVIVPIVVTST